MLLAEPLTDRAIGCIAMSGIHIGLLLNFSAPRLVDGLRRYVV